MLDLIAKLEAATEESRELDAMIVVALGLRPDWAPTGEMWIDREAGIGEPVVRINSIGRKSGGNVPIGDYAHYTTSLDAALTLVPEGWGWWRVGRSPGRSLEFVAKIGRDETMGFLTFWAATPALALCIAALKARSV